MPTIENQGMHNVKALQAMSDPELIAQNLAQQGAIHAISHLLLQGCTESKAMEMLASLRMQATQIRAVASERGMNTFEQDQIAFT